MLKDIKEVKCQKCSGKGTQKCDQCNNSHFLSCEDCKGKGSQKCEKYKGSGKITVEIDVREVNQTGDEKKKAEKRIHQCKECFGEGKLTCRKCGGTGKIVCYECKGRPLPCHECNGVGVFYELTESPVPLFITPSKKNYSFMAKKDQWMMKDKEYNKKLESAETYPIQDTTKLNEKDLKELFGVISLDKDLKRCIDETRKTWENLEKEYSKRKSHERPLKPIFVVFLLRLFVETPKKKKFDIYALGTKNKFSIMTYLL